MALTLRPTAAPGVPEPASPASAKASTPASTAASTAASTSASTDERIIEAALQLFADKGYQATGIRDIAEAANISTAALYHYMGTKADLLVKVMVDTLSRCLDAVTRACAELDKPEMKLVAFVRVHVLCSGLFQRQWTVVDNELRALTGTHRATAIALRDRIEQLCADILVEGQQQSVFNAADIRLARLAILEMCNGVTRWYSPSGPASLEEIADQFADLALAMLQARRRGGLLRVSAFKLPPSRYYAQMLTERFDADLRT